MLCDRVREVPTTSRETARRRRGPAGYEGRASDPIPASSGSQVVAAVSGAVEKRLAKHLHPLVRPWLPPLLFDALRPVGGQRFCRADYQRRERQRQMKNDEAQPSLEAAREEFFPGV